MRLSLTIWLQILVRVRFADFFFRRRSGRNAYYEGDDYYESSSRYSRHRSRERDDDRYYSGRGRDRRDRDYYDERDRDDYYRDRRDRRSRSPRRRAGRGRTRFVLVFFGNYIADKFVGLVPLS